MPSAPGAISGSPCNTARLKLRKMFICCPCLLYTSRDLDWGIDVPKRGYEDKKIYIWAENVLGYLSATFVLCEERGIDFKEAYGTESRHYYVHGKDNIPFHTIILPSLLLAHGDGLHLPDNIISSEYMTLEGRKISTSQNWAVWAKDLAEEYNPDAIRYFFIANGPEKRDTDFSWREFKKQNNSELVGAWGNLVNRTLAFAVKFLDCQVTPAIIDANIKKRIRLLYKSVGTKIEKGTFREALEEIFEVVRFGNAYYDAKQPWKTRASNLKECRNTISHCAYLIANIAILLHPFLPFSSSKVSEDVYKRQEGDGPSIALDKAKDAVEEETFEPLLPLFEETGDIFDPLSPPPTAQEAPLQEDAPPPITAQPEPPPAKEPPMLSPAERLVQMEEVLKPITGMQEPFDPTAERGGLIGGCLLYTSCIKRIGRKDLRGGLITPASSKPIILLKYCNIVMKNCTKFTICPL